MTPEYLRELADLADPGRMWRLSGWDQMRLPSEMRKQLDVGVALRRYAEHVRRVQALIGTGKSLVVTPLTPSSSASMTIPTPDEHRQMQGQFKTFDEAFRAEAEELFDRVSALERTTDDGKTWSPLEWGPVAGKVYEDKKRACELASPAGLRMNDGSSVRFALPRRL